MWSGTSVGFRNKLVGSGMVPRTQECVVRVAEGHGHDNSSLLKQQAHGSSSDSELVDFIGVLDDLMYSNGM